MTTAKKNKRAARLTPARVEGLKASATTYRVTDAAAPAPGLLLAVRPSGHKAWLSRVTVRPTGGGKAHRVDVPQGPWPGVGIEQAREKHARAVADAYAGVDPRFVVDPAAAALRFGEMMEEWLAHLEHVGKLAPDTVTDHRRRWTMYLAPLDALALGDITRQHVAPILSRLGRQHPARCRAVLATLRQAMKWSLERTWIETNPVADMDPAAFGGVASAGRSRALSLEELRRVWEAAGNMTPSMGALVRVLILTGARRAEVAGLPIEEIDLAAGEWRLPESRTKTGEGRTVALCAEAVEILRQQIGERTAGPVFVGHGGQAIHPDSVTKAVKRLQRPATKRAKAGPLADMEAFTVHDLRRSAATAWGEHLGAAPHVIDAALGHANGDRVTKTYQRQRYALEQADLMRRWGEVVADHVARDPGAEVVPFRRPAAGAGE